MSEEFYYSIIPESTVEAEKVRKAKKVLEFCKESLKQIFNRELPEFELQWIELTTQKAYEEDGIFRKFHEAFNKLFSVESPRAFDPNAFKDGDSVLGMFTVRKHSDGSRSPKILLRSDIPIHQIPGTMAHELYHLIYWDIKGRRPFTLIEQTEQEGMADDFTENLLEKMRKEVSFYI